MAKKYLDYDGLLYFWQKIKTTFALASAIPQKTSTTPIMDGTAAIGNETTWAAGNHVHPTDTSRAPLASPAFTGTPTAPTAATTTNNTQIATTAFVKSVVGSMTSGVSDVTVDGTSVVTSGVADIPYADWRINKYGLVRVSQTSSHHYLTVYAKENGVSPVGIAVPLLGNGLIYSDVLPTATTSAQGAMSAADKSKLDSITMTNGIIDSSVLPSFVDDVIEAYPRTGQTELSSTWLSETSGGSALTPETGKIYILMADSTSYATNTQFRWSGTAYVKMLDGGVSSITNAEIDTIVAS